MKHRDGRVAVFFGAVFADEDFHEGRRTAAGLVLFFVNTI